MQPDTCGPAFRISPEKAGAAVFGYAAGLDMTRRDLQLAAREKGRPWDLGRAFEHSAVIGTITAAAAFGTIRDQRIRLEVDGIIRQDARLSDLVWNVESLISHLSRYYHLRAGDLIYTGTPAGVGKVATGANLHGEIEGLEAIDVTIGPAQ